MFRRTLRNHYFPELTLDVNELKALIMSAGRGFSQSMTEPSRNQQRKMQRSSWIDFGTRTLGLFMK